MPVVRNANEKSVDELGTEIAALAERARTGALAAEELRGSTFTVSSAGKLAGLFQTPIVNHPEVAILSIGRVAPRAVVRDGEIVVRRTGALAITFDHRVVDGARAAAFGLAVIARVQSGRASVRVVLFVPTIKEGERCVHAWSDSSSCSGWLPLGSATRRHERTGAPIATGDGEVPANALAGAGAGELHLSKRRVEPRVQAERREHRERRAGAHPHGAGRRQRSDRGLAVSVDVRRRHRSMPGRIEWNARARARSPLRISSARSRVSRWGRSSLRWTRATRTSTCTRAEFPPGGDPGRPPVVASRAREERTGGPASGPRPL